MAGQRIDAVMLEVDAPRDGEINILLRIFDGNRCKWDAVDQWAGNGSEAALGLCEALSGFERLAVALCNSRGVQLELPFP
jgi:hypothetical protein